VLSATVAPVSPQLPLKQRQLFRLYQHSMAVQIMHQDHVATTILLVDKFGYAAARGKTIIIENHNPASRYTRPNPMKTSLAD
jgi:hypothetical protein